MELAKLEVTFFVADSVVFARYSDFRYLVVWVCIPGLVNGTASATRAPCGQSPEPPLHVCLARSKILLPKSLVARLGFSVFFLSFFLSGKVNFVLYERGIHGTLSCGCG